MNLTDNKPLPQIMPLQGLAPAAGGAVRPLAPPECRDDAPC